MSLLKNALEKNSQSSELKEKESGASGLSITQHRTHKLDEEQVRVTHKKVDPAICKMWEFHDRAYELLSLEDCKELIESLLAEGKQQFPAIVRSLGAAAEGEPRYEVIAGARRHWSITYIRNNYPEHKDFPFLIEPRELTDQEAYQLMDAENREDVSKDISEYERANSYAKSVSENVFESWRQLSSEIGLSRGQADRFKKMSELPSSIVKLFPDRREIKLSYAENLMKLLSNPATKEKVLNKAKSLNTKHYTSLEVYKELVKATTEKPPTQTIEWDADKSGKQAMTAKVKSTGDLQIVIKSKAGATKAELVRYFKEALEQLK